MLSAYDNINRKLLCDSSSFVLLWLLMTFTWWDISVPTDKEERDMYAIKIQRGTLKECDADLDVSVWHDAAMTRYHRTKLTSLSNCWEIIKCMLSFHRCWVIIIILGRCTSPSLLMHNLPTFISNLESPKTTSRGLVKHRKSWYRNATPWKSEITTSRRSGSV